MFKKQQETDQSKTIILLSLGHFHAQMSLKILEKNMEICALFVKIPLLKKLNLTDSLSKRGGGKVLTRPKWTKLPKCIFYCQIRLFWKVAIHEKL